MDYFLRKIIFFPTYFLREKARQFGNMPRLRTNHYVNCVQERIVLKT